MSDLYNDLRTLADDLASARSTLERELKETRALYYSQERERIARFKRLQEEREERLRS